jgi:hypothetical protein
LQPHKTDAYQFEPGWYYAYHNPGDGGYEPIRYCPDCGRKLPDLSKVKRK